MGTVLAENLLVTDRLAQEDRTLDSSKPITVSRGQMTSAWGKKKFKVNPLDSVTVHKFQPGALSISTD